MPQQEGLCFHHTYEYNKQHSLQFLVESTRVQRTKAFKCVPVTETLNQDFQTLCCSVMMDEAETSLLKLTVQSMDQVSSLPTLAEGLHHRICNSPVITVVTKRRSPHCLPEEFLKSTWITLIP